MSSTTASDLEDRSLIPPSLAWWPKLCLPIVGLLCVTLGSLALDVTQGPLDSREGAKLQATNVKLAPPTSIELSLETLRDGTFTPGLERKLRDESRARYHLGPYASMAMWRGLGVAHPHLVAGTHEWLFSGDRVRGLRAWDEPRAAKILAVHRGLARRLETFGHRLVFLPLATKATTVPERLTDPALARPSRYARWMRRYQRSGLTTLESLPAMQSLAAEDRWLPRDTHWSSRAQELVAQSVAEQLKPLLAPGPAAPPTTLGPAERKARTADLLRYGGMLEADPTQAPDYGPGEWVRPVLNAQGQLGPRAPRFAPARGASRPSVIVTGTSFMAGRIFATYLRHFLQRPVANAAKPSLGSEIPTAALLGPARAMRKGPPVVVLVDVLQHLLDQGRVSALEVLRELTKNPPREAFALGSWSPKTGSEPSALVDLVLAPRGGNPRRIFRTATANEIFCDGSGIVGYEFELKAPLAGENAKLFLGEAWPIMPLPTELTRFTIPILRNSPGSYSALAISERLLAATSSVRLVLDVAAVHPELLVVAIDRPSPAQWRLRSTLPFLAQPELVERAPAVLLQRLPKGSPPIIERITWVYEDGQSVTREATGAAGRKRWLRLAALAPPSRGSARPLHLVLEGRGPSPKAEEIQAAFLQAQP